MLQKKMYKNNFASLVNVTTPPTVYLITQTKIVTNGDAQSLSFLFCFFEAVNTERLCCLFSLLMDELWPCPASFHPSLICKHTHALFIYFCFNLSLFQFAMARGAHPHPCCVLLGSPEQNFPFPSSCSHRPCSVLREFPISPDSDKRLYTEGLLVTLGTSQKQKGVWFPDPNASPPTLWFGYRSTACQGTLSQGPGYPGNLKRFDLYKGSLRPCVVAWERGYFWCIFNSLSVQQCVSL